MQPFAKIKRLDKRWRWLLAFLLALVAAIFFYPLTITVVPSWDLRVVDDAHVPVKGINVTEHWQHYLLEDVGHEDVLTTSGDGHGNFPERTIRASMASRLLATIRNLPINGGRGRMNPYASIVVWGHKDYETTVASYRQDEAPQSGIVVRRQR